MRSVTRRAGQTAPPPQGIHATTPRSRPVYPARVGRLEETPPWRLVPDQEHGDPLGDAGADQVAGGAAVAAGIAFALVRNDLWERPPAEGRNYLLQCAIWALAWAPRACSRSRGQRPHRRDASVSGRFRGRAIFDSTARHVRGLIGPYSRRRTASASTSEGSPNPRPYPNTSATVLEPNRLSSSSR